MRHTPVNQTFVEFEIGDAIAQQAADAITLLEHRDRMSGPRQLLCRGQAGRPGANHGNFLSALMTRRLRCNPAVLACLVDDGALDGLDANRVLLDVQRTGSLAGCRADAAGEFGKIIGRMQYVDGFLPLSAIDQIVPVGDDIVDWTTVVAKRNPAIHAARTLHLGLRVIQMRHKLVVMHYPRRRFLVGLDDSLKFLESGWHAHLSNLFLCDF